VVLCGVKGCDGAGQTGRAIVEGLTWNPWNGFESIDGSQMARPI